ncbi:glycosyltransferase [Bradyrhizobium sp. ARR65]|uniref:glycosyltransferase n=1 Tax=Bradyrhizobium sp. ARR65 TaxID=1040989 RepID=UPI00046512CC|nr:glycosyltransferase [Bradyrhizobium sp. ARR65]
MIFVTVGAQMAFDRLIRTVDEWAGSHDGTDVFAQIGPSNYHPRFIRVTKFIDPPDFRKTVEASNLIVAHAGMGSIITALELGKPIIVMPRRGDLRETRNDHQVATANYLVKGARVVVALDEEMLLRKLDRMDSLAATERIGTSASPELIGKLREFIEHRTESAFEPH